jgi:REP element-mobilizing transposase RayT
VFVEGGIYHVYNRFARGAEVFAEGDEAERFLGLLHTVKSRDGLTVFAWCLMSNHYHLALRAGPIPLSRTMGYVQARFGQNYNLRHRSSGPRWQSRYQSRLMEDSAYLMQLIAYIHLNPVTAKVVDDPARYPYSGHRELIRKSTKPLIDVDQTLRIYGDTMKDARKNYRAAIKGVRSAEWGGEIPGWLPWWSREPDRPLEEIQPTAWVDEGGISSGRERRLMAPEEFVVRACEVLGQDVEILKGKGYSRRESRDRVLIATLGVERWRQQARRLGQMFGRRADVVSRWVRWGSERRERDERFEELYESLDRKMSSNAARE